MPIIHNFLIKTKIHFPDIRSTVHYSNGSSNILESCYARLAVY